MPNNTSKKNSKTTKAAHISPRRKTTKKSGRNNAATAQSPSNQSTIATKQPGIVVSLIRFLLLLAIGCGLLFALFLVLNEGSKEWFGYDLFKHTEWHKTAIICAGLGVILGLIDEFCKIGNKK